jgi:pyruvate dehydrogenase E2 component (dihydrolipoamide acetyltransferase)
MAISVVMPALEMAQETGRLIAWRKKEGEPVAKGEALLEIETDKAVMEIESPGDGILTAVKVHEGAEVPVGQTIAWIVRPGEVPPPEVAPSQSSGRTATSSTRPAAATEKIKEQQAGAGPRISPKARRLVRERGVDISQLRGTGPEGAILAEDVLASATSSGSPASASIEELGPVARLMAERSAQSWTTVPHFFVVREVDAGALVRTRDRLTRQENSAGVRPTYTDLLIALVAGVLRKHPPLNASWTGSGIRLNQDIHIGVAVAVKDGVVAAVIRNADKSDLRKIAVQSRELAQRARTGRLRPQDISGGTFTISNLGMYKVDAFSAIITPPQAAILAIGRISDRVVPVDGRPGIRPMLTMTLSADHRVVDGARAAAFLSDLAEAVGAPAEWLALE